MGVACVRACHASAIRGKDVGDERRELEPRNYVPPQVVKVVVGNKLDKVKSLQPTRERLERFPIR